MDTQGFQSFLQSRNLTDPQMEQYISIVIQFEEYLNTQIPPLSLETANAGTTQSFVDTLILEGSNSYEHLLALARYGRFCKNNILFVAILELLDGAEAYEGLYQKVGEVLGMDKQQEIFKDCLVPPLGLSNQKKSRLIQVVMQRLEGMLNAESRLRIFSSSFRDLKDEYYQNDKKEYWEIGNIDQYLEIKRQKFIAELAQIMVGGGLFFSQEITPEVIEFVRHNPEIEGGVRQGNLLYVTKIPYMAKQYLLENDPDKKKYYLCHCPWARESLKNGEIAVSSNFCQCSAGFVKKSWEVIFGQSLQCDMLESVLQGDLRCRFAIHLPAGLV